MVQDTPVINHHGDVVGNASLDRGEDDITRSPEEWVVGGNTESEFREDVGEEVETLAPPVSGAGKVRNIDLEIVEIEISSETETVGLPKNELATEEMIVFHHMVTKGKPSSGM
jgi:hypothetical protein